MLNRVMMEAGQRSIMDMYQIKHQKRDFLQVFSYFLRNNVTILALKPLHHLNIIQLQMTLRRHNLLYLPDLFFLHFLSCFQAVLFNVCRLVITVCEEIKSAAFLGDFSEIGFHFVSGKGEGGACFSCLCIDFIYLSEAVNEIQVLIIIEKAF